MAQLSGQLTVNGSTQFSSIACNIVALKAHPDNTDAVWVGNDGSDVVSEDTGFPLEPGETLLVRVDGDLNELYADADVTNEKICWFIVY